MNFNSISMIASPIVPFKAKVFSGCADIRDETFQIKRRNLKKTQNKGARHERQRIPNSFSRGFEKKP
jgi:hypothetical protein